MATKRAKYLHDIWYPLKNHSKKPISAHWHCKTATSSSMEISNYFSLQNYQGKLKNRQIWYTVPLKTLKTKYAVKPIFKSEHLNRPLAKPGSDCLDRIGSDWQFALNSRQKWSRDILGMKIAERTNLLILFVFFLMVKWSLAYLNGFLFRGDNWNVNVKRKGTIFRPVTRGGGVHGVRSHLPTGPKGRHFDTQYPS